MKLCAIVLAAGFSSRMGCNKLLMDYHGYPMAEYILYNLRRNQKWFEQIVVVSRLPFLEQLTHRYGFTYLHNPEPERGMGHS
ncbi:NTP transferase domain-containing protein, partial [Ligaoa zhengdingensis]